MADSILTNCTSGGCGAKIGPDELCGILKGISGGSSEKLIVGFDSSDDAAVYKIGGGKYLISTIDFFPPMVEDAKSFGRIAAANALSDVYAMGGKPILALNMVCFPEKLEKTFLAEILAGGAEKVSEAGAVIGGGHSIYDRELKYGLSVTGTVKEEQLLRNDTPSLGDKIILTKALGVGIIMAAARVKMASDAAYNAAVASMERLNKYAAEKLSGFDVHACTDVTGFGLLAHAAEMVSDKHSMIINPEALPVLTQAREYAEEYLITAAGQRNRSHLEKKGVFADELDFAVQELLFDPQTSGGLLISVAKAEADELLCKIRVDDPMAAIIGEISEKSDSIIKFE